MGLFDDHIPHEEKMAELDREISMRVVVYDRRVADGKMKHETANRKILVMRAILADYREGRVSDPPA